MAPTRPAELADDGFGMTESQGDWPRRGEGVGTAATFLTKTSEASAAVLRVWRQAKGSCWALPSPRTRHLLNIMVGPFPTHSFPTLHKLAAKFHRTYNVHIKQLRCPALSVIPPYLEPPFES